MQVINIKLGFSYVLILIQNNVEIHLAVPILADTIEIKNVLLYFKYTKSAKLVSQSNNPKQNPVIPINIINNEFFYIFFLNLLLPYYTYFYPFLIHYTYSLILSSWFIYI